MTWREKFPKNTRPAYDELLAFLPEGVRELFARFSGEIAERYRVYNKWHRYEPADGWVYGYCRNYRVELLRVTIGDGCFNALGIEVSDDDTLRQALDRVKFAYDAGYEARYERIVTEKKANQSERAKIRTAREREQMTKLTENLDTERFNRFRWAPKVSRSKLILLYRTEAEGRVDGDLLDDVGYAFYARCRQAKEVRSCMDRGQIVCHYCDAVLTPGSYTAVVRCGCGYSYTYREYRRSCNAANIPGGRAAPIFEAFYEKWPGCHDARAKMLLIDWLIHECHVTIMSGEQGRSVCVNLIEGTIPQLKVMLEALAAG